MASVASVALHLSVPVTANWGAAPLCCPPRPAKPQSLKANLKFFALLIVLEYKIVN